MINTDVHSVGPSYPNSGASTTIPSELISRDQWVAWRYSEDKRHKVPLNPRTGRKASTTDPKTWGTHEQAEAARQEHGYDGIGFVLTPDDPFSFIDLDDVRDPNTGEVEPWAMEIVEKAGSYAEITPSRRGLRIAVRGKIPFKKAGSKPVELFSQGGFVTTTGDVLAGFGGPIVEAQDALEELYREYCQPKTVEVEHPPAPLPEPIDLPDSELLEKARNAEFGREFTALFDAGDMSAFGNDHHRADYALMRQLRYWTQADSDRMVRLFSESALAQRDKWKSRPDYIRRTLNAALKRGGKVYEPEKHRPNKTRVRDRIREKVAYAILLHPWKEKAGRADAGATDFFGYLGSLRLAHKANTPEIDLSIRDYMEAAGIQDFTTALNSLARLEDTHRLVEKVRDGNHGNATRYRLRDVPKPKHIEIREETSILNPPCAYNVCAGLLAPLAGAYLIRNSSPEMPDYDKNGRKIPKGPAPLVKSVGKAAAMVAYLIHATAPLFEGGVIPPSFVSERTGISKRHLRERHIPKLSTPGLVEEVEGGYAVPEDVSTALKEELRVSGSLAAANHQRKRHDQQRRAQEIKRLAWVGHDAEQIHVETGFDPEEISAVLSPTDQDPTKAEMDARKLARSADGEYAELVKESPVWEGAFPDPDATEQPLGHDHQEVTEEPVSRSAPVQRGTAPSDYRDGSERPTEALDETPCKHSYGGHVFPGGRGCYCCDSNHPSRRTGVIDLDEYRGNRGVA